MRAILRFFLGLFVVVCGFFLLGICVLVVLSVLDAPMVRFGPSPDIFPAGSWASHMAIPLKLLMVCVPMFLILALFAGICVGAMKALSVEKKSKDKKEDAEETRLIQELHIGFSKLEERVETLETILMDRAKVEDFKTSLRR